jgi:hypothetical protein
MELIFKRARSRNLDHALTGHLGRVELRWSKRDLGGGEPPAQ